LEVFLRQNQKLKNMKTIIHRANSRGRSKYDWLDSKHNFSFAGYMDRNRINFGALRVLNDDIVIPGAGFGKHPHDNMEIISIPLKGELMHEDSMNHKQVIRENEVQVMSAGTGLFHAEYNASNTDEVNFLQLWIYPNKKNIKPVYDQKFFNPKEGKNTWQPLVSGADNETGETLRIQQDAHITRTFLEAGKEIKYKPRRTSYGSYLFIVYGEILYNSETFSDRDAVGIVGNSEFTIKANSDTYVLNIEVPDIASN
jgi:hypothetical protein